MSRIPSIDHEALFNQSSNPSLLITPELLIAGANDSYLQLTGMNREDITGKPLFEVFPGTGSESAQIAASLKRVLVNKIPETLPVVRYSIPTHATTGPGVEERYWSTTHVPVLNADGEVELILQNVFDVTELYRHQLHMKDQHARRAQLSPAALRLEGVVFRHARMTERANFHLHEESSYLRSLFEQAPGFVCILKGSDHVFELSNKAYRDLVGSGRDLVGKPVREALPEVADQGFFELLDQVYNSGEPYVGRAQNVMLRRAGGEELESRYLDFIYQPLTEPNGNVTGIFVLGHDVTVSYHLEQKLAHLATHDDLTGLTNRRAFKKLVTKIVEAETTPAEHALLHLGLDQFKVVNDSCGTTAGDELLRYVSVLLESQAPADAKVARLGSDEFGIFLPNTTRADAKQVAEHLREKVSDVDFCWGALRFGLSASIGVICFDGRSLALKEILSTAAAVCYLAKDKGRNRVYLYDPTDAELIQRRQGMDWIGRLRDALQDKRLLLYAQRIQALGSPGKGKDRYEILVRLQDVNGKMIQPMAFLPAAERYNLMPLIDRYVVKATFRYLGEEVAAGRDDTIYSINLSGTTLADNSFIEFVITHAAEFGVPARLVCFEITETAAVANLTDATRMMSELQAEGFKFALDDFGSGVSSFGYLKSLPVDSLKVDGRFVRGIADDPVDCAMVDAIARIARVMGLNTVAEYAENSAILDKLEEIGVDYAQGYAIHRPELLATLVHDLLPGSRYGDSRMSTS